MIKSQYILRKYHQGAQKLLVILGVWQNYLKLYNLVSHLERKTVNVLCLKDPFGFAFFKGIDGQSDLPALKTFLETEITELGLTMDQVAISSICVSALPAIWLGLKMKVKQVFVFSPMTYARPDFIQVLEKYSDGIGCNTGNMAVYDRAMTEYNKDPTIFDTYYDLNNFENVFNTNGKATQVKLFFGEKCPHDLYYRDYLSDTIQSKVELVMVPGITEIRQLIPSLHDSSLKQDLLA